MGRRVPGSWIPFLVLAVLPSAAFAQGTIAGAVKDTSGAVLPGVTVEAASSALIEKTRTVVTDGTGQYRIENLRPGAYAITFSLQGFNTVKREGIELTGTFTATVNAELRVGALEETITVTGETPVVDVQNTTRQQVLDRDVIGAIPSGRSPTFLAALLPSVSVANQDVGGVLGVGRSSGTVTVHGNTDVRTQVNGISVHSAEGNGAAGVGNIAAYQELAVDTSGISAEQKEGGVRMNLVPREGGNTFAGSFYAAFANSAMASDNFTQALKDRGLGVPNSLEKLWEYNPSIGGPIKRDKVWFFATVRINDAVNNAPIFFNKNTGNPNVWTYEPDIARGPVPNESEWKGANGRVTWQASTKHKLSGAIDFVKQCQCPLASATLSPEAASWMFSDPKRMLFGDWTAPLTNRLLFEASAVRQFDHAQRWGDNGNPFFTLAPGAPRMIGVTEQSTGLIYRASGQGSPSGTDDRNTTFVYRTAMSYITGAHSMKVGVNLGKNHQDEIRYSIDSPMSFRFNNGVPNQLTLQALPLPNELTDYDHGLFVQDRWTLHRLTLTGGLRYDYFHVKFGALTIGPGEFVPNRHITLPATDGVRWHDIEPRSGAALDLFGDGKTALKVSLNKYLAYYGLVRNAFTGNAAPVALLVTTTNRSWRDANNNFVPECNLIDPLANGECGAMSAPDFGTPRIGVSYDPDTLTGWNKRSYNWQFSAGVQRELLPRVSLDASYFRTWFGNFVVTDNRALTAADYDQFSITAPSDPRLPGGGGNVIAGLYDVKPAKFSVPSDNYLTFAEKFGKQVQRWDGIDLTVSARPRPDVQVGGGLSSGRTTTDNCDVVDDLPELLFGGANLGVANNNVWLPASQCRQQSKFLTQVKFLGTYTVPKADVQLTATVQSVPGPQIVANYVATNAVVAPSLGRPLAGGSNNVTINIVEPGRLYGERMNQFDLRFGKILRLGRVRTTASLDVYNVFNSNAVLTQSNSYATWLQPQSILTARFAKAVVQLEF